MMIFQILKNPETSKSVFYKCFYAISICKKDLDGTTIARNFKAVKISLVIKAIVTFVELSIPIALMNFFQEKFIYNCALRI